MCQSCGAVFAGAACDECGASVRAAPSRPAAPPPLPVSPPPIPAAPPPIPSRSAASVLPPLRAAKALTPPPLPLPDPPAAFSEPSRPTIDLQPRPFSEPSHPAIDLASPQFSEPSRPKIEAARPFSEPSRPKIEAARPFSEPSRPSIDVSTRPFSEPSRPKVDTARPFSEPSRPGQRIVRPATPPSAPAPERPVTGSQPAIPAPIASRPTPPLPPAEDFEISADEDERAGDPKPESPGAKKEPMREVVKIRGPRLVARSRTSDLQRATSDLSNSEFGSSRVVGVTTGRPQTPPVASNAKAEALYQQALADRDAGNLTSSLRNVKLAKAFDPTNSVYANMYDQLNLTLGNSVSDGVPKAPPVAPGPKKRSPSKRG